MRRLDAADKTESVFHLATPRRRRDCTAAMHTPLPRWVIRVEGSRGPPSMHFRCSPKS